MNVYFDTNVYSFISERDEVREIQRLIRQGRHRLLASASNLFELLSNSDIASRGRAVNTLLHLASAYERQPVSWLHSVELRGEIARCRPEWLRRVTYAKLVRQLLQSHTRRWKDARQGIMPSHDAFANYRVVFKSGVSQVRTSQKALRSVLKLNPDFSLAWNEPKWEPEPKVDFDDPEVFWRVDCLLAWHNAVAVRNEASRDYADWLTPYLKQNAFSDASYIQFWLDDVRAAMVPRNRLTGLIEYYQARHQITGGNAEDQLHANKLFDVDVFFTADRTFHDILVEITKRHVSVSCRLAFVNQATGSAVNEIAAALAAPMTMGSTLECGRRVAPHSRKASPMKVHS